jgi:cytochrome c peroxidase
MKKVCVLSFILAIIAILTAFTKDRSMAAYSLTYQEKLALFKLETNSLLQTIQQTDISTLAGREKINHQVNVAREQMKRMDFWFRYLEPIMYRKINGPLPVEWETEVFEKFEAPYKREGAGLTLAALYMEEAGFKKDSLLSLIQQALDATATFSADSITGTLKTHHHFFLCNRLFLLNLAAIYTTGFECPDTARVIPELRILLEDVGETYRVFNESFPATPLNEAYLSLYNKAIAFAGKQPEEFTRFDHFSFIKDYINPLFRLNQQFINAYRVMTRSFVDYSLSKTSKSIFDKQLYYGQNPKGLFLRVQDEALLAEMDRVGKLLFYDPVLSGNNKRSCASCHKPTEYFADTLLAASRQFNGKDLLERNTPSLVNAGFNHLLMLDGAHISLQNQARAVLVNPAELGGNETEIVKKVMSCPDYKKVFDRLLEYTPAQPEMSIDHITSTITFYYSKFSNYFAPFDEAINDNKSLSEDARKGFNVFMSKAQCATCHFVPQFNGVKPPYVGSEFEVLGVPADTSFSKLSDDKGRYGVNPAAETLNAFRTGSLRNAEYTAPFMHNGVFKTLEQVIDFYDAGGGAGRGLTVNNQTLSSDSLHLSPMEKSQLLAFMRSLNEQIRFEPPPEKLPASKNKQLNSRKPGGEY